MYLDKICLLGLLIALFFIYILVVLKKKNIDFGYRTIIAMFLGIILGAIFPQKMEYVYPIGKIYIGFITAMVIPLLFISVVSSIIHLKDISRLKNIGLKAVFWLTLNTILASILALIICLLTNIGQNITINLTEDYVAREVPNITEVIIDLFPQNIFVDAYNNKIVSIITFSILIGISILYVNNKIKDFILDCQAIINKAISILVEFTPYAVLSLIATSVANNSIDKLLPLISVLIISYIICIVHLFGINSILLLICGKINPKYFFKKMFTALTTAFTSQSSVATLPITIKCLDNMGVDKSVYSFTAPLGTTMGMPACAGIWPVVLAVVCINSLNIEYSISQYILLIIITGIVSIGTVGVPGTSTITTTAIFTAMGLPLDVIVITTPISMVVDMIRTATNVAGAGVSSIMVAKSENKLNLQKYKS